jgi:hypothetical protein
MPNFGSVPAVIYGGTDLPSFQEYEVEIARVELASTLGDVISVRARPGQNGRIVYAVVDEYDTEYSIPIANSSSPLSLGELIEFIDGTEWGESVDHRCGLADGFRNQLLDWGSQPQEAVNFVRVCSFYYASLEVYYDRQALRWLEDHTEDDE